MSKIQELQLIKNLLTNRLPHDIKIIHVPVRRSVYGDWEIDVDLTIGQREEKDQLLPPGATTETIKINEYKISEVGGPTSMSIFIGYGEISGTLAIGIECYHMVVLSRYSEPK